MLTVCVPLYGVKLHSKVNPRSQRLSGDYLGRGEGKLLVYIYSFPTIISIACHNLRYFIVLIVLLSVLRLQSFQDFERSGDLINFSSFFPSHSLYSMLSIATKISSTTSLWVLLYPLALSSAVPAPNPTSLKVPVQHTRTGSTRSVVGNQYDTGACRNGPSTRSCWGDFSIDTDAYRH